MRAVEFNWLTKVDDVEYNRADNIVCFCLSLADSYVDVQVTPTAKRSVEIITDSNPQNAIEVFYPQLNPNDVCIVGDYDQVHAISGMPFTLTAYQFNDLNNFLYEHIEENRKWVK